MFLRDKVAIHRDSTGRLGFFGSRSASVNPRPSGIGANSDAEAKMKFRNKDGEITMGAQAALLCGAIAVMVGGVGALYKNTDRPDYAAMAKARADKREAENDRKLAQSLHERLKAF
jgi:hypothetical protein